MYDNKKIFYHVLKGNDRSPESQVSILNSSQVSKRFFFSIGQGQLTPQSMVGPFMTSIKGRNSDHHGNISVQK